MTVLERNVTFFASHTVVEESILVEKYNQATGYNKKILDSLPKSHPEQVYSHPRSWRALDDPYTKDSFKVCLELTFKYVDFCVNTTFIWSDSDEANSKTVHGKADILRVVQIYAAFFHHVGNSVEWVDFLLMMYCDYYEGAVCRKSIETIPKQYSRVWHINECENVMCAGTADKTPREVHLGVRLLLVRGHSEGGVDPAEGVEDVLRNLLGVDAIDGVPHVLPRRNDEAERDEDRNGDRMVQSEDWRIDVDMADADERFETAENVQHFTITSASLLVRFKSLFVGRGSQFTNI
nr:unnamed protein product [Callosobruchus chinensis]